MASSKEPKLEASGGTENEERKKDDMVNKPTSSDKSCSCGIKDAKYRCPKCDIRYCSVDCCKNHGMVCKKGVSGTFLACDLIRLKERQKNNQPLNIPSKDRIPLELLVDMKNNERLNGILKNEKVRALVKKLDDSDDHPAIFEEVMRQPEFQDFYNAIMEGFGVKQENGQQS